MGQLQVYQEALADKRLVSQFNGNRFDKELKWAAEKQFAMQIIAGNDALQRCDPESIRLAMLEVAFSGLSLAPMFGRGYLIPWDGVAKFSPGYKGLLHLVHRADTMRSCQAVLVYAADKFKVVTKDNVRTIDHEEARGNRGAVTEGYTIATLANGERLVDVVDAAYFIACEKASTKKNAKGGMVWRSDFKNDMKIKSAIRHAWKYWPQDSGGHIAHAIEVANRAEPADFTPTPDAVKKEAELCLSEDQVLQLHAYLTGQELPSKDADTWLQKMAEAMGVGKIEYVPARLFDDAMGRLKDRFARWRATQ